MAVFFSKKQKAEFRKGKRRIEVRKKNEGGGDEPVGKNGSAKRQCQEEEEVKDAPVVTDSDNLSNTNEDSSNSAVVIIPQKLSSQDARKFRKDARRKARAEGKDADKLEFVIEGSQSAKKKGTSTIGSSSKKSSNNKKKRKREFPCLNDLVKEEQEAKKKKEEEDALQQSEEALSEEYKSRYLALDCEMVGIGTDGKKSVLARASLVDWDGKTVFDTFVQVPTRV